MVEKVQKYSLWIIQSCIILLGIATIFIATEYHIFLFWETENSTRELESSAYFKVNLDR